MPEEGGCRGFLNSLICALCIAPAILIGTTVTLGWNEQRAVCDSKAITQGEDEAVDIGCDSASEGAGQLVKLSCDLSKAGLTAITEPLGSEFSSVMNYVGTGLRVEVEMLQCVEHKRSGSSALGNYTYSVEWKSSHVDSSFFHEKHRENWEDHCNANNPPWPAALPTPGTTYAPSVGVGAFTIEGEYVGWVPLDTPVSATSTPSGWSRSGNQYDSSKWEVNSGLFGQGISAGIGKVRVKFMGTDWTNPKVTVLGKNNNGRVQRWTAGDSWLCSGFTLADLRAGVVSKEDLFSNLRAESSAVTMVLRIVGFLLAWFAFSRLFVPLQVAVDCIPCVGPCLGDALETITCCISCLPGCACTLGVVGVVWVAMRPMVGIPLMLVFFCTFAGFVGFKIYSQQQKSGDPSDPENPEAPEVVGNES